ncbi:MAG: amidohydrolase [Ruminococcaceae bacterium]|nr:amidohydrolase [Oscillospiraceae bacterium]
MIEEKFTVIDAHCHIYPEKIVDRAVAGTDAFYSTHAACRGVASELLEIGDRIGIDRFVVQSVATTPKQVSSINEFIAASVATAPDRFTGLGAAHPDSESQDAVIRQIKELGLHGIKIHPDIQGFAIDDPRMMRVYELCEEERLPILMHTGDYRYDFSNPNRLLPVLKAFPELIVIGAHFGGWSVWDDASRVLAEFPNLFVDCSSTFPFANNDLDLGERLIARYGAERVMFGSDFPMWSPERELETFMKLKLSDAERRMILSENAKRVYKIN